MLPPGRNPSPRASAVALPVPPWQNDPAKRPTESPTMATVPVLGNPTYPTTDGKPMAETDLHRMLMSDLIATLDAHFVDDPMTYVSGNLLVFYEPGNRRRHVSPDVFLVRGVEKKPRLNYLIWEERGHAPDVVIELTSASTRREDVDKKSR